MSILILCITCRHTIAALRRKPVYHMCMEQEHVITGLLRKRQEIADALEIAQGKVRQLIQNVDAVDATLKLFRPDKEIGIVRVRPTPRRHAAFRGESSRMILTMLREAGAPMTTRDIVSRSWRRAG